MITISAFKLIILFVLTIFVSTMCGLFVAIIASSKQDLYDDILLNDIDRLRQMLQMAADDIAALDGSDPNAYLRDLSTRDYYEEMAQI